MSRAAHGTGTASAQPGPASDVSAVVRITREIARDLHWMTLGVREPWGPPLPGQFVSLTLAPDWEDDRAGEADGALLRRPFGIASYRGAAAGGEAEIGLLYASVGGVTRAMAGLPSGAALRLLGPTGSTFPDPPPGHPLLVAGGRGIGPLLFLAQRLSERRTFDLLYGARTGEALMPLPEFAGGTIHLATDDGGVGRRGTATDLLRALEPEVPCSVLACGPHAMLEEVARIAAERGWACWVAVEEIFGCGLGLCGGCAIPAAAPIDEYGRYLWVCRDGPVLRADRIDWEAWGRRSTG